MQTIVLSLCNCAPLPEVSRTVFTRSSNHLLSFKENGSPKAACATMDVPSKKLAGRTPLVRSMIWDGMAKSPGLTSSRRDPTAEKARMARTPRDLRAAMLARAGTAEGAMLCPVPCLARKATCLPEGRAQMAMGELGNPQGCFRMNLNNYCAHCNKEICSLFLGLRACCETWSKSRKTRQRLSFVHT